MSRAPSVLLICWNLIFSSYSETRALITSSKSAPTWKLGMLKFVISGATCSKECACILSNESGARPPPPTHPVTYLLLQVILGLLSYHICFLRWSVFLILSRWRGIFRRLGIETHKANSKMCPQNSVCHVFILSLLNEYWSFGHSNLWFQVKRKLIFNPSCVSIPIS